jgi:hypothetical protein
MMVDAATTTRFTVCAFGIAPKNPCLPADVKSTVSGLFDLAIGVGKIGIGIAGIPETGGLSLYAAYSGLSNIVSGAAELYGGVSGNISRGETIANYASSLGSISGATTLAITGNAKYGATASAIEGIGFAAFTGGLASQGDLPTPGLPDNAISTLDNGMSVGGLLGLGGCHF